jgi:hypothetical protein
MFLYLVSEQCQTFFRIAKPNAIFALISIS